MELYSERCEAAVDSIAYDAARMEHGRETTCYIVIILFLRYKYWYHEKWLFKDQDVEK